MKQVSSPRIEPQVLREIQEEALDQEARLALVPLPNEPHRNRWAFWAVVALILAVLAVLIAVSAILSGRSAR